MSDFAQTGRICTLQRLNTLHLQTIEARTAELAKTRPIALILPCQRRDLHGPALRHIVAELRDAEFVEVVVLSLNGVTESDASAAAEFFANWPRRWTVLHNDDALAARGVSGKGGNIAAALRHVLQENRCAIIATQDCDVASFRREDLARLCFPLLDPQLDYRFAKMYYSRATSRLFARTSRLILAPLLQALVSVAGHQPLLDFLLSFRYPLAGECAFTREVAAALEPASGWAFEIGQLCEVFRLLDPRAVCQVDGGEGYDHQHQSAATLLTEMAPAIAGELLRQCAREGLTIDAAFCAALAAAYQRESELGLQRWRSLARINDVPWDEAEERDVAIRFAESLAILQFAPSDSRLGGAGVR